MKSLSIKLAVVLIGLTIFGNTEVWGADWKLFDMSTDDNWYYDVTSITRPSKDIVRVWTMMMYTDKGVAEMVRKYGTSCENIGYTKAFEEISCSEKKARILSYIHYSKEGGKVIFSSPSASEWNYISPESRWEGLYKLMCK